MTLTPLGEPLLLTDQVFSAIRDAIMSGAMAPGDRLRLRDLAAQLGTSPMPVREAIGRLEQSGLVVRIPHRGAVVADLTPTELAHVYDARLLLESEAARLGAMAATSADLAQMRAALDQMRAAVDRGHIGQALDRDEDVLSTLYAAGGNPVLLGLIRDLWQRCRAFKLLGAAYPDGGGAWSSQDPLIAAVHAHDADAAVAVTRESLRTAQQRIRAMLVETAVGR